MPARKASTPVRSPKKAKSKRSVGRPRGTQSKNWNSIVGRLEVADKNSTLDVVISHMLTAKSASATAYYLNKTFDGIKACSHGRAVHIRKASQ